MSKPDSTSEPPFATAREMVLRETLRPAPTTDAWRALVEVRIETIRPGSHAIDDDPIVRVVVPVSLLPNNCAACKKLLVSDALPSTMSLLLESVILSVLES